METKKFKVAVIGLGRQSREDHLPGIVHSQFSELVAVCDKNESLVQSIAQEYAVNGYTNCDELLKNEKIDFAIIAVTHDAYIDIIPKLTKNGIHILKEKPLSRNLEEGFVLHKDIQQNNVECMITLQRRFNPIFSSFLQLKDQLGKLYHVDCRSTMFLENPQSGWRASSKQSGGGVILDLGYHMIDLIIWYFGLPDSVYAEFSVNKDKSADHEVEDMGTVLFSYKNGFHGSLFVSSFSPPKEQSIRLTGSRGIIHLNRGSITRMNNNGEVIENLIREKSWPSAAAEQIDYFCRIINKERENHGSAHYHLQHMAFIEAIYTSKKENTSVSPLELLKKYEKKQSTRSVGWRKNSNSKNTTLHLA